MGRYSKYSIPDRWLPYTKFGRQIYGTKFICFKVPLKQEICSRIDSIEDVFTPKQLIEDVPNLGLIIDLTNTDRYYDSQEFTEKGIQYQKISCPGKQVPPLDIVKRFSRVVNEFIKSNDKDSLIGVHCTHGVNRTGYFICRYMIEHLKLSPTEAISAFNTARGHNMERENYVDVLNGLKPGEISGDVTDSSSGCHDDRTNNSGDWKTSVPIRDEKRRNWRDQKQSEPIGRDVTDHRYMRSASRENGNDNDRPWVHGQEFSNSRPPHRQFVPYQRSPPYNHQNNGGFRGRADHHSFGNDRRNRLRNPYGRTDEGSFQDSNSNQLPPLTRGSDEHRSPLDRIESHSDYRESYTRGFENHGSYGNPNWRGRDSQRSSGEPVTGGFYGNSLNGDPNSRGYSTNNSSGEPFTRGYDTLAPYGDPNSRGYNSNSSYHPGTNIPFSDRYYNRSYQ